jgi:hypothetical protein
VITVRLIGGLGNQMFQFAAGRRLALHHGVPLRLDLGWFGNQGPDDTERTYELGVFAGDSAAVKARLQLPEPRNRRELAWQRLGERLGRRSHVVRQSGNAFDPAVLHAPDGAHLVGYWQSERFFVDHAETIRADFTLVEPLSAPAQTTLRAIAQAPASVSLHVRRGDYVTNPHALRYHGTRGADYYSRAVELVCERAGGPLELFVFSDDPDWCERELQLGHPTTVVRGNPGHEDLMLMSRCRHHVLANSSFSWWGAWLDPARAGIVVAPSPWAQQADDFDDIYLESWLRL